MSSVYVDRSEVEKKFGVFCFGRWLVTCLSDFSSTQNRKGKMVALLEVVEDVTTQLFFRALEELQPQVICQTALRAQWPIVDALKASEAEADRKLQQMFMFLRAARNRQPVPSDTPASGAAHGTHEASLRRWFRQSETAVINALVAFITSLSPGTRCADYAAEVFVNELHFCLFAATCQWRAFIASGSIEFVNPPSVRFAQQRSESSNASEVNLPEDADYFWLCYFVLLLIGEEGVEKHLQTSATPLAPRGVKQSLESVKYTAEGTLCNAVTVIQLCNAYARIHTMQTYVDTPTDSEHCHAAGIGDILKAAAKRQRTMEETPPHLLQVTLGRCRLQSVPPKKPLAVDDETCQVLRRLNGVVCAAAGCLHDCPSASLRGLLVLWSVRLSTAVAIVSYAGSSYSNEPRGDGFISLAQACCSCLHTLGRVLLSQQRADVRQSSSESGSKSWYTEWPTTLRQCLSTAFVILCSAGGIVLRSEGASGGGSQLTVAAARALCDASDSLLSATMNMLAVTGVSRETFSEMAWGAVLNVFNCAHAVEDSVPCRARLSVDGIAALYACSKNMLLRTREDAAIKVVEPVQPHGSPSVQRQLYSSSVHEEEIDSATVSKASIQLAALLLYAESLTDVVSVFVRGNKRLEAFAVSFSSGPGSYTALPAVSSESLSRSHWLAAVASLKVAVSLNDSSPHAMVNSHTKDSFVTACKWDDLSSWRNVGSSSNAASPKSSALLATLPRAYKVALSFFSYAVDSLFSFADSDTDVDKSSRLDATVALCESLAQVLIATNSTNEGTPQHHLLTCAATSLIQVALELSRSTMGSADAEAAKARHELECHNAIFHARMLSLVRNEVAAV